MCTGPYDLTRSYLETLSSADLTAISYDYGIEIPENFSRSFIITEILDTLEEQDINYIDIPETTTTPTVLELPFSYNENRITATLKNPVWCYVAWDFNSETLESIESNPLFESIIIRFSYSKTIEKNEIVENTDIIIKTADREQFILVTPDFPRFTVSLIATYKNKKEFVIATSSEVIKPKFPVAINLKTLQKKYSNIQTLSGLNNVLRTHYSDHRQSFVGN